MDEGYKTGVKLSESPPQLGLHFGVWTLIQATRRHDYKDQQT